MAPRYSYEILELRREEAEAPTSLKIRVSLQGVSQEQQVEVRASGKVVEVKAIPDAPSSPNATTSFTIKLPHHVDPDKTKATRWEEELTIVLPIISLNPSE